MLKISCDFGDWVKLIESDKIEQEMDITDDEIKGLQKSN